MKNEEMFLKHAKKHDKIKENGTLVGLFAESCKITQGNPYRVANHSGASALMETLNPVVPRASANSVMLSSSGSMPINSMTFN